MKILIDSLSDPTGWAINAPSTITQNEIPIYIAGYNSASLLIQFDQADGTRTAEKAIGPIDVSEYDSLVLSGWSQRKGNTMFRKQEDFAYAISLADGHNFTLGIRNTFTDITIPLNGITEITRIRITALHGESDAIVISEAIAERQQMPEDSLTAIQEGLRVYMDQMPAKSLATASLAADSSTIALSAPWVTKYSCIKIEGGGNTEIHQLGDQGADGFKFLSTFDGKFIQNDYTDAQVTLYYPITINPNEQEVMLPGVVIWGFSPEPISRSNRLNEEIYSYNIDTGKAAVRFEGQLFEQSVFIDMEAHQHELIAEMARAAKRYISAEVAWINGRKHEMAYEGAPIETQPPTGVDIVPSLRIVAIMEYVEQTYEYEERTPVTTTNISVQGG
jgi:hypothetical protein